MKILVTGGAGFIGSNFIHRIIYNPEVELVVNLDKFSYAANMANISRLNNYPKYRLETLDLVNKDALLSIFENYNFTHVVHFAAESHVDNSIKDADPFIQSNIIGTYNLIEMCRKFEVKRFHHVSTDEVYGALTDVGKFNEGTCYDPHNPYSASKAASDMLVTGFGKTFNLPYTISNCSNNYGPRQHKEKFIPVVIKSLIDGKKIPVYGKGNNVRDRIHVEDHCEAIWQILVRGRIGETYLVGANCEKTNLEVVEEICRAFGVSSEDSIEFVEDRKGHDFRYAIDNSKIVRELNWSAMYEFESGIKSTVELYKAIHQQ